jgi:non-heme chloroperoxidase
MPHVTVGRENSAEIRIHYEDWGEGDPVVLIHGFPLDGQSWERQVPALLREGYRVIAMDRRGFGRSSRPSVGYDYDTFTEDLARLVEELDLRRMVLVGFSMGTGEVTRYLARHGSDRVRAAVLMAPVPPFLLRTDDNPEGVPHGVFDEIVQAIRADRPAFLKSFLDDFNNVDKLGDSRISKQAWQAQWTVAANASAIGTERCVGAWLTDFRADLRENDVPTLVVQGDEDRILPIDATGRRLPALLKDSHWTEIPGGPHNIGWTHADEVNLALTTFLRDTAR